MSRQSIQAGKAIIVVDLVDKATQSFKKMQSNLMGAARGFRDISTNAAGMALLTGVPIAKGLGNYARFTNEIQNIEAKLGNFGKTSNIVRQNSVELRSEIIKLGRDTAYTSEEVAKAAGVLAQGGLEEFGGGTIKASLKSIIDLGRGTALALEDAANMAVSLATTFKVIRPGNTTEQVTSAMSQLADQIVKAGRLSIAGADDIGASLVYVAQKANDLGVTVPEVLALLNQLAQAGIKGSVAGTSLNTAFGNLSNNLEKIKKTFPNFNIIFKNNGSVDAIETFGRLGQLMKGMSVLAKTTFLQDIFNLRGERAASALEDLEGMRKGYEQIKDSANEASKSSQTMQAGFGGALERMKGALDALEIKLGVRFDKVLKGTTEIIALMIDKVSELSIKYLALTGVILLSPVIFASMAIGALSLSFILARLSVVVGLVLKGFRGLKSVGGIMLGGAKSLASPLAAMANTRNIKAAAIKKTSERVAKLQLAYDTALIKANAKKTVAAQAAAITKLNASKNTAKLFEAGIDLKKLKTAGGIKGGIASVETASKAFNTSIRSIGLLKTIFSNAGLGKTITGIAQLAFSFTRLSFSITRFVFSWNFVGIALNALLLFGDKIPFIRKAFTDLGSAFSSAFAQIGKIATYATPAFNLFGLAIEAFASGNSAIGIRALAAGFESIVSIISNQLTAAWNAFAAKVTDLWMSIKQIGGSLVIIFTSLFAGLGEIFGNAFQGISERVSKLFSGEGESTFFSVIELMALTMNNFITEFSKAIINLQDWSGQFLTRITDIASGKFTVMQVTEPSRRFVDAIRGGGTTSPEPTNPRINDLETARLKREKDILYLFSDKGNKAERNNAVDDANLESESASNYSAYLYQKFLDSLNKITSEATITAQNAVKPPFVENTEQGDSPDVQRFIMKLDSLVGSLGETRNIYRIDKDSQILETRRTNELLREQTRVIQTQGMIGN